VAHSNWALKNVLKVKTAIKELIKTNYINCRVNY